MRSGDLSIQLNNPLAEDLELFLKLTTDIWSLFKNTRIFITGGTGFFGTWLLESFAKANDTLELNANVLVLSRNPGAFIKKAPHLASHPAIDFWEGDVVNFEFPKGKFEYIIHAATEASARMIDEDPVGMINAVVLGTNHTLEFAREAGTKRFLLTSSGAVYGKQPPEMERVREDYFGAPDTCDPGFAYGEAKRLAEQLCTSYMKQYGIACTIARCFAFVGPYLPLDIHYAVGNFIRDARNGGPIKINGDGTPYRSYMYAMDLMVWLWTILIKGQPGRTYNVGSDEAICIADLARIISSRFGPKTEIIIAKEPVLDKNPDRYVPNIDRAVKELSLKLSTRLDNALQKTIAYHELISHTKN